MILYSASSVFSTAVCSVALGQPRRGEELVCLSVFRLQRRVFCSVPCVPGPPCFPQLPRRDPRAQCTSSLSWEAREKLRGRWRISLSHPNLELELGLTWPSARDCEVLTGLVIETELFKCQEKQNRRGADRTTACSTEGTTMFYIMNRLRTSVNVLTWALGQTQISKQSLWNSSCPQLFRENVSSEVSVRRK